MKKKILGMVLCAAMLTAMTAGCTPESGGSSSSAGSGDKNAEEGSGKVFMTVSNQQNEFMVGMGESFLEVGKAAGYDVQLMDADLDATQQVSQIETAISEGAEAILIEPCSVDGLTSGLQAAHDAGIPIFVIHNNVSATDLITSLIHVDVQQGGELKMQRCMDDIGGKGNIAIMTGTLGQDTTNQICSGYDKVLEKYPDVNVVFGAQQMQLLLQKTGLHLERKSMQLYAIMTAWLSELSLYLNPQVKQVIFLYMDLTLLRKVLRL